MSDNQTSASPSRHYRVLSVLGQGGYGTVYRARLESDDGFSRDYAVKMLSMEGAPASTLQRFRDEARILGLIRDRAVVGVQPPTRLGGRWAVVMEFVDGASARALLEHEVFPPTVALEVVQEVCRALHKVFNQEGPDGDPLRLIHRDLKPGNLQITPDGEVKILDFGIARAEFKNREATTTQHIGGTLGYIAPERLNGEEVPSGDVYSLGVVLHQLVTGEMPRRAYGEMKLPEDASGSVRDALELSWRMRQLEPDERPSAREVEQACREIRQRYPDEAFLRDWSERQVPQLDALPRDEVVGQVLSETVSRNSDSGLFMLGGDELLGLPPPDFTPSNPTISVPLEADELPLVESRPPSLESQSAVDSSFGEPSATSEVIRIPTQARRSVGRAGRAIGLLVLALLVFVVLGWMVTRDTTPVLDKPELPDGPAIRSSVEVAHANRAQPEEVVDEAEDGPDPAAEPGPAVRTGSGAPSAPAPDRQADVEEPSELPAAGAPEADPAEAVDEEVAVAEVSAPEPVETPQRTEETVEDAGGSARAVEETPEEEPASTRPAAPDLRGAWTGKSSGRELRLLIESQDGDTLAGRVEIILGTTVRATPVSGAYDVASSTMRLSEGGGGLLLVASVAGDELSGTLQAREGARPQRLDASRR